jgi:hypothetical protein
LARHKLLAILKTTVKEHPHMAPIVRAIVQNENKHYLAASVDVAGEVSYASKPERKYDYTRRLRTTIGRYIRRNIPIHVTDYELDVFCRDVVTKMCPIAEYFTIIKGDDIEQAYGDEVGGHSCMTGDDCDKVRLYTQNPDVVQMVVFNDRKMTGRALLWTDDEGRQLLDRIYPNDGYHISMFYKYAEINGWTVRKHNGAPCSGQPFVDDLTHTVYVRPPNNELWPYMDSLRFSDSDPEDDKVRLSTSYGRYCLDSISGGFGDYNGSYYRCEQCGCRVHEDDVYSVNDYTYCSDCYCELFTSCSNCGSDCDRDDVTYVESEDGYICESCLDYNYSTCDHCGEYHRTRRLAVTPEGYSCEHCFDDYWTRCEVCDEVIPAGEACCETCQQERDEAAEVDVEDTQEVPCG